MRLKFCQKLIDCIRGKNKRCNKIFLERKDGSIKKIKKVKGLKIIENGRKSKLIFKEKIPLFKNSFIVMGDSSTIIIEPSMHVFNTFEINNRGINNFCYIGKNFSNTGKVHLSFGKENDLKISIGNDCMFATNVFVRASDFHPIIDIHSNKQINKGHSIEIGNHVWLAMNTTILKGSCIPNNSVVATGSIVTKKLSTENSIYAGSPAKIIKTNINWNR